MIVYLDSSFVVPLYSVDAHSPAANSAIGSVIGTPWITTLGEIEIINALRLRAFRKQVTLDEAERSITNFDLDVRHGIFELKPLPESTFRVARGLSQINTAQLGIRTADLLHIAAAQTLGASHFFSFDTLQRKVLETTGLHLNPLP
jgi:predicted nucleic acid-binding protein